MDPADVMDVLIKSLNDFVEAGDEFTVDCGGIQGLDGRIRYATFSDVPGCGYYNDQFRFPAVGIGSHSCRVSAHETILATMEAVQ